MEKKHLFQNLVKKTNKFKELIIITVILITSIMIFLFIFVDDYQKLNESIQNERIESVGQMGDLILEKINLVSESYSSELTQASNLLMASDVSSLEEIKELFTNIDDLCIVTEKGDCFLLSGDYIYFKDLTKILGKLYQRDVDTLFSSTQSRGDFWIFTTPLRNVKVGNDNAIGLLKLIDVKKYAEITTNYIFDNAGATYVVNLGGVVLFSPGDVESEAFFQGYNIISKLEDELVSSKKIEILRNALTNNTEAEIVVDIRDETWLIQTIPGPSERNIVLTVPISITAKETFANMRSTIFTIITLALLLLLLVLTWGLYFTRRNSILKLEKAKANSKSDFMNKVSHDIRTPLNAIVGMIDIAQKTIDDKNSILECLDSAQKSSKYLIALINDVLDVSRIENGKMIIVKDPFDLKELVDDIVKIEHHAAKLKNISFLVDDEIEEEKILYIGDMTRIKQILINLISNAIKFTKEDGTVELIVEKEKYDENKRLITFKVKDNGIGMSKEFMKNIFEPFEQETTFGGTNGINGSGLGLTIVYHLVNLMNGNITVDSKKNVGTEFVIEILLDVIKNEREEKNDLPLKDEITDYLKGKRILLAEDNEINRTIITYYLTEMGMEVEEVGDGKEVYEYFLNSETNYYDLILMDIQMPEMDGLEATKCIRISEHEDAKTIPIIALSANAFVEDEKKSLEAGMQAHLSKPIDPLELKNTIARYVIKEKR